MPSLPRLPIDQVAGAQSGGGGRVGREPCDAARLANVVGSLVDGPTDSWVRGQPARWINEPRRLPEQEHMDGPIGWTDTTYALTQIERRDAEAIAPLRAATIEHQRPTS
jgi:hypothetical protein